MWIKHSRKHKPYSLYGSELARTLESKNHVKIKITLRVMENGCIWEGISLMNTCLVYQSLFYQI